MPPGERQPTGFRVSCDPGSALVTWLRLDEDDVEGAGAVHPLDPVQLDVAGSGRLIQVSGRRGSSRANAWNAIGAATRAWEPGSYQP